MSHHRAEKDSNAWMQTLWRPMMGWMYMLICLLDMAVFPILWALWQGYNHVPITQWNPLTLQGAGLFHIAMGAVLGIAAFGRTQEKLAGTAANPTATSQTMTNNTNMSGVPSGMQGGMGGMNSGGFGGGNNSSFGGAPAFGAPQAGSFGSSSGFGSTAPSAAPSSFGGGGFGSAPATPAFGAGSTAPTVNTSGKKVVPSFGQPAL
jgi:Holin of 3TMs, for gene-transfer release